MANTNPTCSAKGYTEGTEKICLSLRSRIWVETDTKDGDEILGDSMIGPAALANAGNW